MKIIIDAFGGDNAPDEVIKAALRAVKENKDLFIVLTGDEKVLNEKFSALQMEIPSQIKFYHLPEIVNNCDDPTKVIRTKPNSSLIGGLRLLSEDGGDAFLSAGNTGALLAGATLIVKRIQGIKRAALAILFPKKIGRIMVLDNGANIDCKAEYYSQFALMGSIYIKKVLGIDRPKVGLINIGEEEAKGNDIVKDAYQLLKKDKRINFGGNLEPRYLLQSDFDVAVCDGWTGNIMLKTVEGTAMTLMSLIKDIFKKNAVSMFSAILVKKGLKGLKSKFDYADYGGAPVLGIQKPVIKAHGSSNEKAFYNAILQAKTFYDLKIIEELSDLISK